MSMPQLFHGSHASIFIIMLFWQMNDKLDDFNTVQLINISELIISKFSVEFMKQINLF